MLGCPHFTTFDGQNFDFQGAGEFILTRSTTSGDNFEVQVRIEPEGSEDSSVSIITQVAVAVGTDRVTFAADRPQVVWVDGSPVDLSQNPVFTLAGGTVSAISSEEFRVALNTGEVVTVDPFGDGMGVSITLAPTDGPGSIQGFLGSDAGQASDFQLPDGTVLQQPLTQTELYQEFANAWRITQSESLFDYAPGQTTDTFTNTQYPREILTLADFPSDLVSAAAALVAAAGITDPILAADAEFDYITMGDPSYIVDDAAVGALSSTTATQATITEHVTPPPSIGVLAANTKVSETASGSTPVTFKVNLTSAATIDTVVNYAVVSGGMLTGQGESFLVAADFGGMLPSGSVTIAAGQTMATVTINVPDSAIGSAPNRWLQVMVTSPDGNPVYFPTAQAEIVNNAPEPGTLATPAIQLLPNSSPVASENPASLAVSGTAYTVNLGQVLSGAALPALQFAVANTAALGSDNLSAVISAITGTGFQVSGNQPPATLAGGTTYQNLYFQPETTTLGAQSESITLTSNDTNDSGYTGSLPTLTLTVEDTVIAPAKAVETPTNVSFANVRVGTAETQAISVSNVAAPLAANLDVTVAAGPGTHAAGSVTALAPGATDSTDLTVGLGTGSAGLQTGTVTLDTFSDLGNNVMVPALPSPTVTLTGAVYRPAQATVTLTNQILHVGDPGTDTLTVTNTDAPDGYSENLLASVTGATGQFAGTTGTTGEIAAGTSDDSSIGLTLSTAQAGTITGSVTLGLTSDGGTGTGSLDGLGSIALPAETVTLSATVDNYASAAFVELTGTPQLTGAGNSYTLDLGTVARGSAPVSVELGVVNTAQGMADTLAGSFTASGDPAIALSGFTNFTGLTAFRIHSGLDVTLDTNQLGTFTEEVTLTPTGTNASGYEGALPAETITITGDVQNSVACYSRGTRILTVRGEVPVEELQIGDLVATFTGVGAPLKPVRWMGYRRIDLRRHADPENTHPIRFRAGALGEGCPYRDLVVSPGHRMRIDDVLVMALELVNGASIVQESPDEIEYWHVELDGHDLVLAEGMQAETYVDTGNRSAFENAAVTALHPALDGDVPDPCLPYAGASSAVRARLIARAEALGCTRSIDPAPWLEIDGQRIEPSRNGQHCRFTLPAVFQSVRLRSRAGRPWDVDPYSGDRRQLGLKLHRLVLETRTGPREVLLTSPGLRHGFHRVESDTEGRTCRWTIGDSLLDLSGLLPGETVTALEIAFDQALPMWLGSEPACIGGLPDASHGTVEVTGSRPC